jgi:hypothetical protein
VFKWRTEIISYRLEQNSALSTVPVKAQHSALLAVPEQVLLTVLEQVSVLRLLLEPPLEMLLLQGQLLLGRPVPANSPEQQCQLYIPSH